MKYIVFIAILAMASFSAMAGDEAVVAANDSVGNYSERYPILARFINIPIEEIDMLSKSVRMDMCDYLLQGDSLYRVENALQGESCFETVNRNYLRLRLTPVSLVEMRLLGNKKGNLLAMVYTVGDSVQARDSRISFLDSENKKLQNARILPKIELKEFFSFPDKKTQKRILDMIAYPTIEYSFDEDEDVLKARLNVANSLDIEKAKEINKYLGLPLAFTWKGSKFVREK